MAEAALLALSKISSLLGQVATIVATEYTELKELPCTVQRIRRQLSMMNLFIRKMGASYISDELLKGWIAEVRMLAYRVEDVMDKFSCLYLEFNQDHFLEKAVKGSKYVVEFRKIASELTEIEKEIEHVTKMKDLWVQPAYELLPTQAGNTERQLLQYNVPQLMKDGDLVGNKKKRRQLMTWLTPTPEEKKDGDLKVISVCGMGGMGKTTLVANVYEQRKEKFDVPLWLTVSQTYNGVETLLKKLLEMVGICEGTTSADTGSMDMGKEKPDIESLGIVELKEELMAKFKQKTHLVILDDVWNPQVYDGMRDVFEGSKNGSCIVITTRKEDVAALAPPRYQLELSALGVQDSLRLLCIKAFPHNDYECTPKLLDIVKKFKELPLEKCPKLEELKGIADAIVEKYKCLQLAEYPAELRELADDIVKKANCLLTAKCSSELQNLADGITEKIMDFPLAKCPSELHELTVHIANKCGGLPLAIVSIGSLLSARKQIKPVWKQIYDQLPCELQKDHHVRGILNLSYYDLPGELRNCFLYCSMYPEDCDLPSEMLVRLWIAEGFVVNKGDSTLEEVAEGYVMELIHRNMLQVVNYDELGRVNMCRMHDILRELALSISKAEMFGTVNDLGSIIHMDRDVRRLSAFGRRKMKNDASKMGFLHLRTLMAGETNVVSIRSILDESKYLTVLELQDSGLDEVPASIGYLFNLRYIGLRNTRVKLLPVSMQNLSNLQTLDVKSTKIEKLPPWIVKLTKLRHLFADRFADETQSVFQYLVGVKAPIELFKLEELQTLETVQASEDLAKQLEKMVQLRSVWINNISASHCAKLFATLSTMPLLCSLFLSASNEKEALCFENLRPTSTKLHKLIVRGCWANKTLQCPIFQHHGTNLKYLALSSCYLREDPLVLLALHVPNLSFLRLNNVGGAQELVLPAKSFPHLKTLVLMGMPHVNLLKIEDGSLPGIEELYIKSLPKLATVPQVIESRRHLKKLLVLGLHKDFKDWWNNNKMEQKMQHVAEIHI